MQTEQIDEIREMFRNDDGSCKLSRSDVLRIVDKLAEQQAAQHRVQPIGGNARENDNKESSAANG